MPDYDDYYHMYYYGNEGEPLSTMANSIQNMATGNIYSQYHDVGNIMSTLEEHDTAHDSSK